MTFETSLLIKREKLFMAETYISKQFLVGSELGKAGRIKFGLAIHEALKNSLEQGNL